MGGCGQKCTPDSSFWMDGWINWSDFFMVIHGYIYMHMVKYGCDFLGPGTLKSALSEE